MANKYRERRRQVSVERAGQAAESRERFVPDEPQGPPQPLAIRLLPLWISLGLLLMVAVPYAQVYRHGFLVCDDNVYVYENPYVRMGLTWEGVKWAFSDPHAGNWHPLTWMSHMLDWQLFRQARVEGQEMRPEDGSWAGGHHLMNVMLHALSAVALFFALKLMTRTFWSSAMVAALFAIHPLRVESVAWAAERKDVLSCLFWMLTLLAYAWYVKRPGVGKYLLIFIAFGLGSLAKAMLVTLPFALLLLDVWPLHRWRLRPAPPPGPGRRLPRDASISPWLLILEKLPLLGLAAAISWIAVIGQIRGVAMNSEEALPYGVRILNALISYVAYIGQTFWPRNLSIFYAHQYMLPDGIGRAYKLQAAAAGMFLLLISAVAVWLLLRTRPRPYFAVGWFWYLGTLVPVIGIIQVGIQARADRYTYIPSIGLYLILVWTAREIVRLWRPARTMIFAAAPAALVLLTTITYFQVSCWHDNFTLFEHAVAVTENNYFAYNHLGLGYDGLGTQAAKLGHDADARKEYDEAAKNYSEALKIKPNYDFANNNLGVCFARKGETEKAERQFIYATQINGTYADALSNLGVLCTMNGKPREAIGYCERACQARGDNRASDIRSLAKAHEVAGDVDEAIRLYRAALLVDREDTASHVGLGGCLAQQGHDDDAIECYKQALRYAPTSLDAWIRFAQLLKKTNRVDEAIKAYERIVEIVGLAPGSVEAHNNLAELYTKQGDPSRAAKHAQAAQEMKQAVFQQITALIAQCEGELRTNPGNVDAHNTLGALYAQLGEAAKARQHFAEVLRLAPDHAAAKRNLKILEGKTSPTNPIGQ